MSTTAYVSATLLGGKKVMTIGMLVMQEAVANLNAPLASALAIVVTLAGLIFAGLCTWGLNRAMPWRAGRPGESLSLPGWCVALAEALGPTLSRLLLAASIGLLLLPLGLVVVQSVNDVPLATAAGFRGFTWKWYEQVLFGGSYTASFLVSLQLAVVSVLVALALATPAAFALARYPFAGRSALLAFWLLPLSLPQIVIGVGMLKLLQIYVAIPAFLGLVGIHVVIILPFVIALLTTSVQALDRAQPRRRPDPPLPAGHAAGAGARPVRGRRHRLPDELRRGHRHQLPDHGAHDHATGPNLFGSDHARTHRPCHLGPADRRDSPDALAGRARGAARQALCPLRREP